MTVVRLGAYQQATAKLPARPFQQINRSLALTRAYADAITTEQQQFVSRLAVGVLSAITADMGTLTAGKIIMASTTHIFAIGVGFGDASQFLMWYGPRPTADNLALCQDAAGGSFPGIFYIKTSGAAPVETQSIATSAVITAKLADLGVTTAKLNDLAVSTAKLVDAAITSVKLADASVASAKLIDGAVITAKLADLGITNGKLAAGAVTAAKIAADTITATEIAAGAITTSELAALAVTAAKIAAHTITAGEIAAGTITATEIAALTITAAQIAASTITAAKIASHTITAAEIAALTITASEIAALTITGAKIAADAIVADKITANEIVASKFSLGTNFHNLWPNANSESDPPASVTPVAEGLNLANATGAEFDFRFNAGAPPGSFAGIYVRRIRRSTNGSTALILSRVPVIAGDWYRISGQGKWIQTGGSPQAFTSIKWLDKDFAQLAIPQSVNLPTSATSWTAIAALINKAPANAAYADFSLNLSSLGGGTSEILFDGMIVSREVDTDDIVDRAVTAAKMAGVAGFGNLFGTVTAAAAGGFNTFTGYSASYGGPEVTISAVNGTIQVTNAGKYKVRVAYTMSNPPTADITIRVFRNGTTVVLGPVDVLTAGGEGAAAYLGGTLTLQAGDSLVVQGSEAFGGNTNAILPTWLDFDVMRVDN